MMKCLLPLSMIILFFHGTVFSQPSNGNRGQLGIGYDEGLAARFFFSDKIVAQVGLGLEVFNGSTYYNDEPETDFSISGAFLYTILGTQYVYTDIVAQLAFAHDDTELTDNRGSRNNLFLRGALAPEILIGDHLGLGFRFGLETAIIGDAINNNDGYINFRFFGPDNPFSGGVLGMSLYVYFL